MYLSNPWYLVESVQQILTAEKELIIKAEKVRMFLSWKNDLFATPSLNDCPVLLTLYNSSLCILCRESRMLKTVGPLCEASYADLPIFYPAQNVFGRWP